MEQISGTENSANPRSSEQGQGNGLLIFHHTEHNIDEIGTVHLDLGN